MACKQYFAERKLPECKQGNYAFLSGSVDQPEEKIQGDKRIAWFLGYLDARTNSRLGNIFQKYDLEPMPL